MRLSIVIICWNDLKVIGDCLRSIFTLTRTAEFEVIVSDNGSTDGSLEFIRRNYPVVRIVENGQNLGFARGNNAGIAVARGKYVLILNPDTTVHDGALDKWLEFADEHPEAGAFGCKVLNPDGTNQGAARPFPSIRRDLIAALYLRALGRLSDIFMSDTYVGWDGNSERQVDWQSGCCVMFRGELLGRLGGFDEQFFYHFEEVDLCRRVWNTGYPVVYTPRATITHLGGQSVNRFPIRFVVESYRNRYRYFYKHFGPTAARRCRWVVLLGIGVRRIAYGGLARVHPSDSLRSRLEMYRAAANWNRKVDPVRFVQKAEEPRIEPETVRQSVTTP
jgi:GT2 family glycosyltransferase